MQSKVRAFGLEQPCTQDPLKASQSWFLHLVEHHNVHSEEYIVLSQPKIKKNRFQ